ncbi:MAG: FAD-dependent monooxygenase, partial [Micropepsaceae bacterium]
MKALIAGGGIGGVTAALCLLEAGIDVELYERSSVFSEVGAGIQISPNGVKVLDRLGLREAVDAVAFRPEALEMRTGRLGARIFSIPMREEAVRRYGAPYFHVHRVDLMRVLADALRTRAPNAVHLNKEIQGYAQRADNVALAFTDNTHVQGDVLIGADGIHSRVRAQMLGDTPARFTGNVAWRLVVPAPKL